MQDDSAVEIIYGTLDGKKIKSDPDFHKVLSEAALKLHTKVRNPNSRSRAPIPDPPELRPSPQLTPSTAH